MHRTNRARRPLLLAAVIGLGSALAGETGGISAQQSTAVIRGTVRDADNAPLYGILVNAKGTGKNATTFVFTDDRGVYEFPPLALGAYQVSVGTAQSHPVQLTASGATRDFKGITLGPDLMDQTTGPNWMKVIPGDKAQKTKIAQRCVACHSTNYLITRAPFSADGWSRLVDRMINERLHAADWWPTAQESPVYAHYNEKYSAAEVQAIKDFLIKNVTPETKLQYAAKALWRPKGDAARATYTEWMLAANRGGVRDAWTDPNGIIWYIQSNNLMGRLDPRTGEFQQWDYPADTPAGRFHDIWPDKEGNLFIAAAGLNKVLKFDVKTYQFSTFEIPESLGKYPHTGQFDSAGNYWVTLMEGENSGVVKLDPKTGKLTKFDVPTKYCYCYGLTVDSRDNVWFTQHHANKIGRIEARTGKLTEYTVPTKVALPRRIKVDSKGRLWFTASGYPGQISMLDPETGKFTEYPYEITNGYPYIINIDQHDKIWFNSIEGNMVGKFDPVTKKFSFYLIPVPESYARAGIIDTRTDPPGILLPMASRAGVLGRMYVRPIAEQVTAR
jgi:virginiamycin B lyase